MQKSVSKNDFVCAKKDAWTFIFSDAIRPYSKKYLWISIFLVIALHLVVYFTAPENSLRAIINRDLVVVDEKPIDIPEELLPEKFRTKEKFILSNSINQLPPEDTRNYAASNMRSAQEKDVDSQTKSRLPKNDGEHKDSMATQIVAMQGKIGTKSEDKLKKGIKKVKRKSGDAIAVGEMGDNEKKQEKTVDDTPEFITATPTNSKLRMLLLENNQSTSEIGVCSIDAKFTQYGAYTQRMLEAIQRAWYLNIIRGKIIQGEAVVNIVFSIDKEGLVKNVKIVSSNAETLATYACSDAIESIAPFEAWTDEMISSLGEVDEVSISFYYR